MKKQEVESRKETEEEPVNKVYWQEKQDGVRGKYMYMCSYNTTWVD